MVADRHRVGVFRRVSFYDFVDSRFFCGPTTHIPFLDSQSSARSPNPNLQGLQFRCQVPLESQYYQLPLMALAHQQFRKSFRALWFTLWGMLWP
jgi:hypothetical protein